MDTNPVADVRRPAHPPTDASRSRVSTRSVGCSRSSRRPRRAARPGHHHHGAPDRPASDRAHRLVLTAVEARPDGALRGPHEGRDGPTWRLPEPAVAALIAADPDVPLEARIGDRVFAISARPSTSDSVATGETPASDAITPHVLRHTAAKLQRLVGRERRARLIVARASEHRHDRRLPASPGG